MTTEKDTLLEQVHTQLEMQNYLKAAELAYTPDQIAREMNSVNALYDERAILYNHIRKIGKETDEDSMSEKEKSQGALDDIREKIKESEKKFPLIHRLMLLRDKQL